MVGTIIKFVEQESGNWFELHINPWPENGGKNVFRLDIFNAAGKSILKEDVFIKRSSLRQIEDQLIHVRQTNPEEK